MDISHGTSLRILTTNFATNRSHTSSDDTNYMETGNYAQLQKMNIIGNQVMTIAMTSSSQLSNHIKGHVANQLTTTTNA